MSRSSSYCQLLFAAMTATALVLVSHLPARAADLAEQAHSLAKAPADSAFYSASLRLKEQWHSFLESKAYGKLMEIPLIQLGKMQATFQWQQTTQPVIAQLREYMESPAGNDAVVVLKEMFSDEVFTYGSSDIVESVKFAMELNSMARKARMGAATEDEDAQKEFADKMIKAVTDKIKSGMTVPTLVMGFRIKDAERAKRELDEVHSLLRNVLDEHLPELAAHLQRDQIAGHEFLTLRLDGSMIPWDKIREDEESNKLDDEQFNAIRDALSKKTVVVALGITDEFVILSVGATTDHLEKIGQGASLADQPAIKRLAKHADQAVVSLTYMSKELAQSFGSAQKTLDDFAGGVEEALVQAKVDDEDRQTILEDIRSLDVSKIVPEAGEMSAIAFWTARGYEAYQYTSATRPMMDSSKPLSILKHVGGSPLLMIAGRSKQSIESYTQFVDWLKRIGGHVEKIAEKKADSDDWEKYQEYREQGLALLKRLDEATREYLFPALADGQTAFVMDLSATSKQWFEKMPESPKPLPMLEMAMVGAVSDAEKLRQGVAAYIDIGKDTYKLMQELDPDGSPKMKVPKAKVSDLSGGGKLYEFPFPKKWGVDSQVAVNAGLTDTFAAVSLMPGTTERLLKEQPSSFDTSLPLDHPAAMVSHIEFAKFITATRPWIDYGMDVAMGKLKPKAKKDEDSGDSDEDKPRQPPPAGLIQMGLIVPQIELFLDVTTVLRSATSMTYEEEGVWVTHSETHIEDLK